MKKESFTEKTLEKLRESGKSSESSKKRKTSRLILIIDALVVLAIIIFFFNNESSDIYKTAVLKKNDFNARYSVNYKEGNSEYIITLSIKSNKIKKNKFLFKNFIGALELGYKNKIIQRVLIGEGVNELELLPGEVKTFASSIEKKLITNYLDKNQLFKKKTKKTLFSFSKSYLINSRLTINTKKSSILNIDFNHEAE